MSKKTHHKVSKKNKPEKEHKKHDKTNKQEMKPEVEHEKVEKKETHRKEKNESQAGKMQRVKGALLVLIGILLLGGAAFMLYARITRPLDLGTYLPQDSTFALVQVNITNSGAQELYSQMSKYPVYQKETIISYINNFLNVDYTKQIEPWVGRQLGVALLKQEGADSTKTVSPVAFIEVKNFNMALDFLKTQKLEDGKDSLEIVEFEGQSLYQYTTSHNLYLSFIDDYLVVALEPSVLKTVLEVAKDNDKALENSEKYNKVADNLPGGGVVFGYFDIEELTSFILDSPNLVARNGFILTTFEPFLSIFDAEGFTMTYDDKNLQMQTFTSLNRELLNDKQFLTFKEKYNAELANFVSDDAMVVWGGMNLEKQLKRIADVLGKGSEASMMIFEGLLEAQKNVYFGQNISLQSDIYPLIDNEFMLALYEGDTPRVEVVLELDDEADSMEKIKKIVDGFVKENAVFKPEIREVTLEDGTVGQEIVGVPEEIQSSEIDYNGLKVQAISLGSKGWGIYWFVRDGKLFLATQKDLIEKMQINEKPLKSSQDFSENIAPILSHADEVSYIDLRKFLPKLWPNVESGETDVKQLYLDPFEAVSSGKNYFDDGISTIHNIAIK